MSITHTNTTPNPDGPRTWVPINIASTSTFTSMTAVLHDVLGANARNYLDLRPFRFVRVTGLVTTDDDSAAGPELRAQYSLDNSTFAYFDTAAGTGKSLFTGSTFQPGPWNAIPDAARKGAVVLRIVGFGGDAGASPVIKNLGLEFSA